MSQWDLAADEVKIEHDEPEMDHQFSGISRKDSIAITIDSSLLSPGEMSRIVSRSEDIKNLEAQIEKLKRDEATEQNAYMAIQDTQKKASELNSAVRALVSERTSLEQQWAEMQTVNDSLKAKIAAAEAELHRLNSTTVKISAADSKNYIIEAYKQETAIMKLKSALYENNLQIFEVEERINQKNGQISEVTKVLQEARDDVAKAEFALSVLKADMEKIKNKSALPGTVSLFKSTQTNTVGIVNGSVPEDLISANSAANIDQHTLQTEIDNLKTKLGFAQGEILKQSIEIDLLKKIKSEYELESGSVSITDVPGFTEEGIYGQSTIMSLKAEIEGLKDRIERMEPLFKIGIHTRLRSIELGLKDIRKLKGLTHRLMHDSLLIQGVDAQRSFNSRADATLYLSFGQEHHRPVGEYLDLYDVNANTVWEHRKFNFFQNIITWKVDMITRFKSYNISAFNENYNKLFKAIYPAFEINNDIAIQSSVDLRNSYEILKKEYELAKQSDRGYGNNGYRRGPHQNGPPANLPRPVAASET